MKRIISLILILATLLTVSACGENNRDYDEAEVIAAAEKLIKEEYTDKTWSMLSVALSLAKSALSKVDQAIVDSATKALNDAIATLEKITGEDTDSTPDESDSESASEATADNSGNIEQTEGCGSAIAASAVVLATVLTLGLGLKKKED